MSKVCALICLGFVLVLALATAGVLFPSNAARADENRSEPGSTTVVAHSELGSSTVLWMRSAGYLSVSRFHRGTRINAPIRAMVRMPFECTEIGP